MNNDINTELIYTGTVNVKLKINNKLVELHKHNNGLPQLFKCIAKALSGSDISADKPAYIDLRYINSNLSDWQTCLVAPQSLSQLTYKFENGLWLTKAASTIPYAQLITAPISSLDAVEYRLYLMSKAQDLAYIKIEKSDVESITPGSQALIEWVLRVGNA